MYRITEVQKVFFNGKAKKAFKAYKKDKGSDSFVFIGQFTAPRKAKNSDLQQYITD